MVFIDTHLHLASPDYRNDIVDVVKRARDAGVGQLITIGSGYGAENFDETIQIADRFDIFFALGVHPHDADLGLSSCNEYNARIDSILKRIKCAKSNPKMIAIGEIGLDFYYNHSPRDLQKNTFSALLELASEVRLPVIIHSRDSFNDTIDIIRSVRQRIKGGVFHCFSGTIENARVVLDMGFFISIAGIVTFKKAVEMQRVATYVPLDRILFETDAPFLSPVPYRGRRNEPAYVVEIYRFVSDLKRITIEELKECVLNNVMNCFCIRKEDILDTFKR
ncbi:MAG: TatD family hydrolase [Deltaproteobacteria bacterium]|nr:TatD family hydrolase [Deltaproteobacteria bacterium]